MRWEEAQRRLRILFRPDDRRPEEVISALLRVLLDAGARISEVRRGSTLEQKFLAIK